MTTAQEIDEAIDNSELAAEALSFFDRESAEKMIVELKEKIKEIVS